MRKPIFIVTSVVAITVVAVVGIVNADRVTASIQALVGESPTISDDLVRSAAPATAVRGVALDPTTSTDPDFRETMVSLLAQTVLSSVPPKPTTPRDGVAPVAGLDLTIVLVGSDPLAYGDELHQVRIPGVEGLPPRPPSDGDDAIERYADWRLLEEKWSTEYNDALSAAATGASTITDIAFTDHETSAITATLAKLTQLVPADASLVVLSDLDENEAQQSADIAGRDLLIVQPDPVGDVARADALLASFSAWATEHGAGAIERVRPELAGDALTAYLLGV